MWKQAISFIRRFRTSSSNIELEATEKSISKTRRRELSRLQTSLGYHFQDPFLLDRALTHKSFSHELSVEAATGSADYESLEFLGDALLGFVIAEFLFLTFDDLSEGELTKIRAHLVSTQQLSTLSSRLGLAKFLRLSRGEDKTGGRQKKAILADLFESVIAAIYLDGELEPARNFILNQFRDKFTEIAKGELKLRDHKSALQELLHQRGEPSPHYKVLRETGPDHRKEFLAAVVTSGGELGRGRGGSKKQAEQRAARQAIDRLDDSAEEVPVNQQSEYVVKGMSDNRGRQAASPEEE